MPHLNNLYSRFLLHFAGMAIFPVLLFLCAPSVNAKNHSEALTQEETLEAELRLSKLGFWTGPVDGFQDETMYFATTAFQRVAGLPVTGLLKASDLATLRQASPIRPRVTGFFHFEVDISKQVLFFVDPGGEVSHVLPVATGSGKLFTEGGRTRRALTPTGTLTVRRKIDGWRQSPLGLMYFPSYIQGGVAIHGSRKLARRPATYGCIAVPLFAAETLSKQMPVGTIVIIYK
jgi:L,D-transpeptidase catalytic domain/Putative peptidoglycan binding domain